MIAADGCVKSMLMLVADVFELLPATSVQVPAADWFAPSVVSVAAEVSEPTPEAIRAGLSTHVKVTATAVLFQPFAFGAGETVLEITGGVLSIFTPGDVVKVATFPALSVTVAEVVRFLPSVPIMSALAGTPEATPERLSSVV